MCEHIIVAMGSVTETIQEVIQYLSSKRREKVGLIKVHLYRPPSPEKYFFDVLPDTVKNRSPRQNKRTRCIRRAPLTKTYAPYFITNKTHRSS